MKLNHLHEDGQPREEVPARISKLIQMLESVLADFNATIIQNGLVMPEEIDGEEEAGEASYVVNGHGTKDYRGTILWLKFLFDSAGKIKLYDILAGPSEGEQWDFVDMPITQPYDEFLSWTDGIDVQPPDKDYGLDFLNIVAWVVHAHQQLANEPDLENLFDAGFYKVRLAINHEGDEIVTGYWVEATSSEDARQRAADQAGDRLLEPPKVIAFRREQPGY